jgi:hypothetical protein
MERAVKRAFRALKATHLLPNRGSALATPASLNIDLHYARIGLRTRWTWERYIRLAGFLNYTPAELASVICLKHQALQLCQKENRFNGPACLLLTMLEARAAADYLPDVIPDPFQFHDTPQGS